VVKGWQAYSFSTLRSWFSKKVKTKQLYFVIVFLIYIFTIIFKLPWHMDEFIMYHRLACWFPEQQLNTYREGCMSYPIQIGMFHYFRSYGYIGGISSFILQPFLGIINSIYTPMFLGVIFLICVSIALKRAFALNHNYFWMISLFFPLAFTLIHDGGPVRLGVLTIVLTPLLVQRFLLSIGLQRFLAIASISALWIIATEDKPFFVFLIPGAICFTLAALEANRLPFPDSRRKAQLTGLFVYLSALVIIFLSVSKVSGQSYLAFLKNIAPTPSLGQRIRLAREGLLFMIDWPYFAHRNVNFENISFALPTADSGGQLLRFLSFPLPGLNSVKTQFASTINIFLVIVVSLILLFVILYVLRTKTERHQKSCKLLLLSISFFWIGVWLSGGWASHHYVFVLIPLVPLVILVAKIKNVQFTLLYFLQVVFSFSAFAIVLLTPTRDETSVEITKVYKAAIETSDSKSVINCASWGCYYPFAMLNVNRIPVVFADTEQSINSLTEIAKTRGGKIFHICLSCNAATVRELYPDGTTNILDTSTEIWQVFEISP